MCARTAGDRVCEIISLTCQTFRGYADAMAVSPSPDASAWSSSSKTRPRPTSSTPRCWRRPATPSSAPTTARTPISQAVALAPDLIIMDYELRGIDGCEATERLKQDPRTAAIPIVMITGHVVGERLRTRARRRLRRVPRQAVHLRAAARRGAPAHASARRGRRHRAARRGRRRHPRQRQRDPARRGLRGLAAADGNDALRSCARRPSRRA